MSDNTSDREAEVELTTQVSESGSEGRPSVDMVTATNDPDRVVCLAARNDYYPEYVLDDAFSEVMKTVEPKESDRKWAREFLEGRIDDDENRAEQIAKKHRLIGKLMERGHWGPFEHPGVTFSVKGLSRSCMAQITRHRHASFDVQSMRYVAFDDKNPRESVVHIPELDDPGLSGRNASFAGDVQKNATDAEVIEVRNEIYWDAIEDSFARYQELLNWGAAPENARMVLPIGTQVNLVVSMSLRSLLHIADMRGAADSQWEIRGMTEEMLDLARGWAPITMSYFEENMRGRKNRLSP